MLFEKEKIKQYGMPRSGSNYTKWLIEKNYLAKVHVNIGGWKHGPYLKNNKKSFSTIKNPYSWVISVYNFIMENFNQNVWSPFETELGREATIEDFVKTKFVIKSKENKYDFESPIFYWNFALKNWLESGVIVIRYEDIIKDSNKSLGVLNLKKIGNSLLKNKLKPGMESTIIDEKSFFDSSYYENKEYMLKLNKKCIRAISDYVSYDLAQKVDYKII